MSFAPPKDQAISWHDKIDAKYIKNEAIRRENEKATEAILAGEQPQMDILGAQAQIQGELDDMGGQRFYKPSEVSWKEEFKNFEWDVEVDVTGEASFSKEDLATLNTVLQTIAGNPMVLQDPNAKMVFNKILSLTGAVSPVELQSVPQTPPQPQMPQEQPVPVQ